ncbi:MAG: hypothetical protein QM520_04620 [Gammaproteobacteria bacterium]|nr:hypothetical protein [Gammaproteobacteria bacterium]
MNVFDTIMQWIVDFPLFNVFSNWLGANSSPNEVFLVVIVGSAILGLLLRMVVWLWSFDKIQMKKYKQLMDKFDAGTLEPDDELNAGMIFTRGLEITKEGKMRETRGPSSMVINKIFPS